MIYQNVEREEGRTCSAGTGRRREKERDKRRKGGRIARVLVPAVVLIAGRDERRGGGGLSLQRRDTSGYLHQARSLRASFVSRDISEATIHWRSTIRERKQEHIAARRDSRALDAAGRLRSRRAIARRYRKKRTIRPRRSRVVRR